MLMSRERSIRESHAPAPEAIDEVTAALPAPPQRLPHVELPPVEPRASSKSASPLVLEPEFVAGRVRRPDGSGLPGVQVTLFRTESGVRVESLAHAETDRDGSFSIAFDAAASSVSQVGFSWQRWREFAGDVAMGMPIGPPLDQWLDGSDVVDWTSIAVTMDTGWTLSGIVVTDRPQPLGGVSVVERDSNRPLEVGEAGTFSFPDMPWTTEVAKIDVYVGASIVASPEVSQPAQPGREAWVEVVVH